MWGIPFDEDAYWERRREEYENPRRDPDEEPEPVRDTLFLDEEIDDIEAKYGCTMAQLDEDELLEIVKEFLGIDAEEAVWDEQYLGIEYKYYKGECA